MPYITLRTRMIISSHNSNQTEVKFLENAKPLLQELPRRIWTLNPSMSWHDITAAYPKQIQELNRELTEMASFYFRALKPKLPDILDRQQIKSSTFQVEVINFDLSQPNVLEIAIYFLSQQFRLIDSFGHFLLLSTDVDSQSNIFETFTVRLSPELSIHTYEIEKPI